MKIQMNLVTLFCVQVLLILPSPALADSDDFLNLDENDKKKLDELRNVLSDRLVHDYMKEDDYLIRFLREKNMDVPKTQEMVLNMLRWREENKMDTILSENFDAYDEKYRGTVEGCDKEGRPVLSVRVMDCDVREAIETGKEEELKRYGDRLLEEGALMVRMMKAAGEKGKQVQVVVDLGGFNLMAHACARCMPLYIHGINQVQNYYPGFVYKAVAVNTPRYALPFWDTYKHAVTPRLQKLLHIFGNDKPKWEKFLQEEISPSQLSKEFGGEKSQGEDLHEYRKRKIAFKCSA